MGSSIGSTEFDSTFVPVTFAPALTFVSFASASYAGASVLLLLMLSPYLDYEKALDLMLCPCLFLSCVCPGEPASLTAYAWNYARSTAAYSSADGNDAEAAGCSAYSNDPGVCSFYWCC